MKLLEGIKVVDMTNVLSGPFCTELLALCGAQVIKIENPEGGDLARKLGCLPEINKKFMGTSFIAQNSNKKSLTLNLKSEAAKKIFKKLIKRADVLVENFRPGVMDRLGLSYKTLSQINPKLIYCAISGFGQTGPDAMKPAYDQIIQGLSGVMAVNGSEQFNPMRAGFPVCDTVGGLNAAFAIMGALYHRERHGVAQKIDIAMIDSIMPLMGWVAANLLIGGQKPTLLGNDNFTAAPSGTFKTKDGYLNIAANEQKQWENLTQVLGIPHLKTDPRFQERDIRKKNRKELTPLLEEILKTNTTEHWQKALNEKGIPSGEILDLYSALKAPQVSHRNTIGEVYISELNKAVPVFNLAAKFEKTPGSVDSPPPKLSEHTKEILLDLGYAEKEIEELKEEKII
ncbi:MAG: CoA transferase [Elusimicrobia bacterium]|nr:CoA transferase [Elusimicrobiota bacterium]